MRHRKVPSRLHPSASPHLSPDSTPAFTHYTKSFGKLVSILTHGFLIGAPPQRMIRYLLPDVYGKKAKGPEPKMEPEQFGAVSFTEVPPDEAARVRKDFGPFGVIVSKGWALRRLPQKVEYVDPNAPDFPARRARYEAGYQEIAALIAKSNDAVLEWGIWNADVAFIYGACLWAELCYEYRHLEHIRYVHQKEWRVFSRFPIHRPRRSKLTGVLPPVGWDLADGVSMFHLERKDVIALVVPQGMSVDVRAQLPSGYGDISIVEPAS